MHVNRPGLGQRFHSAKAIIGEEDSPCLSRLDGPQAVAARSGVSSNFRVCGKSETWRAHGRADSFGDFRWYGYDSNGLHDFDLRGSSMI
jgi:hypothetical protein